MTFNPSKISNIADDIAGADLDPLVKIGLAVVLRAVLDLFSDDQARALDAFAWMTGDDFVRDGYAGILGGETIYQRLEDLVAINR